MTSPRARRGTLLLRRRRGSDLLLDRLHVESVVDVSCLELLDVEVVDANDSPAHAVHNDDLTRLFQRLEIDAVSNGSVRKVDCIAVSEASDQAASLEARRHVRHPLNEPFATSWNCTPGRNRPCDLWLRRPRLYTACRTCHNRYTAGKLRFMRHAGLHGNPMFFKSASTWVLNTCMKW